MPSLVRIQHPPQNRPFSGPFYPASPSMPHSHSVFPARARKGREALSGGVRRDGGAGRRGAAVGARPGDASRAQAARAAAGRTGAAPRSAAAGELSGGGASAPRSRFRFRFAGVAQLVERQPSKLNVASSTLVSRSGPFAHLAQLVERVLGKDEVTSSILVVGSKRGRWAPIGAGSVGPARAGDRLRRLVTDSFRPAATQPLVTT